MVYSALGVGGAAEGVALMMAFNRNSAGCQRQSVLPLAFRRYELRDHAPGQAVQRGHEEPALATRRRGGCAQLGARYPARVFELRVVQANRSALRRGLEADHQRRGEGPGLRSEVAEIADLDARLLQHLALRRALEV